MIATPKPPKDARRRRLLLAAGGSAAVVAAAAAGLYVFSSSGDEPERPGSGGDAAAEETVNIGEDGQVLPLEAMDEALTADGNHGTIVEVVDATTAEFRIVRGVDSDHGSHTVVRVTAPEQTADGLTVNVEASWELMANAVNLTEDNFPIITAAGESAAAGELSYESSGPQGPHGVDDEPLTATLTYPDAPERGLLAFRDANAGEDPIPSAGVCYDVSQGFHTNYSNCV